MIRDTAVGIRYGRIWLSGSADVAEEELTLDRGDRTVPATLLRPARDSGEPLPAWILLHGVTVPGRAHPQLTRFARAVAHAGAAVLVPEVPEWAALRLAPTFTAPTVRAALQALAALPGIADRPAGLMGFSFGAPQALAVATDPDLHGRLAGVAAFGGYCDLERTLRFLVLGEHEWEGRTFRSRVDPYGRWIVGANYLNRTAGFEDAVDVARALHALATAAGARQTPSWDPGLEPLRAELATRVAPERRGLFEAFAPATGRRPDRVLAERLIEAMPASIRRVDPLMEPAERLHGIRVPVRLLHGRTDVLIPFTETLRTARALAGHPDLRATVTALFAHTEEDPSPAGVRRMWERARFARAVGEVLRTV